MYLQFLHYVCAYDIKSASNQQSVARHGADSLRQDVNQLMVYCIRIDKSSCFKLESGSRCSRVHLATILIESHLKNLVPSTSSTLGSAHMLRSAEFCSSLVTLASRLCGLYVTKKVKKCVIDLALGRKSRIALATRQERSGVGGQLLDRPARRREGNRCRTSRAGHADGKPPASDRSR